MLVQVMLQGVPATTHTHHHVASQHLWGPRVGRSWLYPMGLTAHQGGCCSWQLGTLTRTKMSMLESPTRYFPSETLIMGNWSGQVQRPRISLT